MNDWVTHVYDVEDTWVGLFKNEDCAREWIGSRSGYTVSTRKPARRDSRVVESPEVLIVHPEVDVLQ